MTAPAPFVHTNSGTSEATWHASDRLLACPILELPGPDTRLVVLAAHPDDEALGVGGLLATWAREGRCLEVVIASDGAASHPLSPTWTTADMVAARQAESVSAVTALGSDIQVTFLHLPDGQLSQHIDAMAAAVTARGIDGPTWVVTPWVGDRHPDHEAAARAGRQVAQDARVTHWQYPIWLWHWSHVDDAPYQRMHLLRLDDDARLAKSAALDCYLTQHRPLSDRPGDEAILPPSMLAHFQRPFEILIDSARSAAEPGYFDLLYAQADDPWGLAERFYEKRKREILLAALPRARFHRAFEPGCATGELTAALSQRCDEVVAADVAERAVSLTRARRDSNVEVGVLRIPAQWPAGLFDLIVLSEVGYYCPDLAALRARIEGSLSPDGVLVCCHWRHPAEEHPHGADDVHRALSTQLHRIVQHVEADFLLDVFTRTGESVAQATGVLSA
jgi:LmbE family N-acetylglucosaminyl deacetylase